MDRLIDHIQFTERLHLKCGFWTRQSCVVMSAHNKVQPIGEGQQESGECSEGNGEITSVSDP